MVGGVSKSIIDHEPQMGDAHDSSRLWKQKRSKEETGVMERMEEKGTQQLGGRGRTKHAPQRTRDH